MFAIGLQADIELTVVTDIPGMCKRRFVSIDGPDNASNQSVYHRKCVGLNSSGLVDSKRLLHVSVIIIVC